MPYITFRFRDLVNGEEIIDESVHGWLPGSEVLDFNQSIVTESSDGVFHCKLHFWTVDGRFYGSTTPTIIIEADPFDCTGWYICSRIPPISGGPTGLRVYGIDAYDQCIIEQEDFIEVPANVTGAFFSTTDGKAEVTAKIVVSVLEEADTWLTKGIDQIISDSAQGEYIGGQEARNLGEALGKARGQELIYGLRLFSHWQLLAGNAEIDQREITVQQGKSAWAVAVYHKPSRIITSLDAAYVQIYRTAHLE